MTINLTIIGLDQVGVSVALALAGNKDKFYLAGHDSNPKRMKAAEATKAFDKCFTHLPDSAKKADIVILALPVDLVNDALQLLSPVLKPATVVIDTSPIRTGISDWAKKHLKDDHYFISVMPIINPKYISDGVGVPVEPHADLFTDGEMLITTDADTKPAAVQTAVDLAALLGSKPYYAEPSEADGVSAEVDLLPKLSAAALVHALIDRPGWKDGRRFASKAFLRSTSSIELLDEEEFFGHTALLNQQNALRSIDMLIDSLQDIRTLIAGMDEDGLKTLLKNGRVNRQTWLEQRTSGDWDKVTESKVRAPKKTFNNLFGIRDPRKRSN